MLSWFRPGCPVDVREKTWIELRMSWLAERFGLERLRSARVVLPTEEFFPEPYDFSEESARRLFDRLCGYVQVPAGSVDLEFFPDEEFDASVRSATGTVIRSQGAAGFYSFGEGRAIVHVARGQLDDAGGISATLIHELSHELLMGRGLLTGDEDDHEPLTDLLPVFLGLGLFGANAVIREGFAQQGLWHHWAVRGQGYLRARHYGYALALFAWFRDEQKPDWAGHLRLDARSTCLAALRYLRTTGDAVFHPNEEGRTYAQRTTNAVLDDLDAGSDGVRVAALWELRDRQPAGPDRTRAVELTVQALAHSNPIIRAEAAGTLDQFGAAAVSAVPALLRTLADSRGQVRMAAAFALGHIGHAGDGVLPDLIGALGDRQPAVANAAAWALAHFGPQAAEAGDGLVRLLRQGLVLCEFALIDQSLETLCAISDDPEGVIAEHLGRRDPELARQAIATLQERRLRAAPGSARGKR